MGRPRHIWLVVEAKYSSEGETKRNATAQGFEVYAPLFREHRVGGVRRVLHLFAPYIFVKIKRDQQWQRLLGTRGVKSVLMNGEKPSQVLHADIELIKSLENEMGYVTIEDEEPPVLSIMQFVTPTAGSWRGQRGIYFGPSQDSRSRSKVVFEMMSRAIEVEIATRDLAPAA